LLFASTFALPAVAEGTMQQQGAQTQTDPTTTAATEPTFDTVMSAIQASKTNVSTIGSLTTVNDVNVVRVGDLAQGNNMQALDQAVTEHQADITSLQSAITANTALKAKLDAEQVQASNVVAADVEADGSVTVFVR
jgi:hypothetical protein